MIVTNFLFKLRSLSHYILGNPCYFCKVIKQILSTSTFEQHFYYVDLLQPVAGSKPTIFDHNFMLSRIGLHNYRNESYIHAVRDNLTRQVQMVLLVIPPNRKDLYDAIKKFTVVEHPGES